MEWTPAPRRNWVKVFAAAAVLVVIGAASWAFFMEHPSGDDTSTVSATAGSVALRSKATQHPAARVNAAPPVPQGSSAPTGGERLPEHAIDSHSSSEHPTADTKPADGKSPDATASEPKGHAESRTGHAAAVDNVPPPVGGLPNIDVNAVTRNMTEKAKQRVDSVGRTITVKPPTFDKPKPSQP